METRMITEIRTKNGGICTVVAFVLMMSTLTLPAWVIEDGTSEWSAVNVAPQADAGPDQTVNEKDAVQLNGSGSKGSIEEKWTVELLDEKLPGPRSTTAAVWNGTHAFVFGGSDEITVFCPENESVWTASARLPFALGRASAVWDGDYAFLFGGRGGGLRDEIIRYDPRSDSLQIMSSRLPTGRAGVTSVYDGNYAYVFGGLGRYSYLDEILRYDTKNDALVTLASVLPHGRDGSSGIYDGRRIYLFAGSEGSGPLLDDIVEFDPNTEIVRTLSTSMPRQYQWTSAIWDGDEAFVFGGGNHVNGYDSILRFNPKTEELVNLPSRLPRPIGATSSIFTGQEAYVFGGENEILPGAFDEIVRFSVQTFVYEISQYEWDFTSDNIYDYQETATNAPDGSFDGKATHVYGDDGSYTVTLKVIDEAGAIDTDTTTVTVLNVPPSLIGDIQAYAKGDLTLRVAGEKWHDVMLGLFEDGNEVGNASVVRHPGSPDDQSVTLENVTINLIGGDLTAVVVYTPMDDPINGQVGGASPAWLIFTPQGGEDVRLHHNFNVKHPDTWLWTVDDFTALLIGVGIAFEATAADLGSDDLTFKWDWDDDSSTSTIYYNDGVGPDPYPSPEVNPMGATDVQIHAYGTSGTYSVTLTVVDDDGGAVSQSFVLTV